MACRTIPWATSSKDGSQTNNSVGTQGLTDTDVSDFIRDLQKMLPDQYHKYIDWDHSRKEQGTWQTKTIVSMWFKNETNLATLVGMLDIVKNSRRCPDSCMGRYFVKIGNEPEKEALGKGSCFFTKVSKQWGEDESKINVVGTIQISFFVWNAMAAKYTFEGESLAGEGWNIKPDVIAAICTEFSEALFEATCHVKLT